jgi:hypothetical protein
VRIDEGLRERCRRTAQEVEQDETDVPQPVLDIVPEDPEIQHVADDVHPAAMHEHRGQDRQLGRDAGKVRRQAVVAEQHGRHDAVGIDGYRAGLLRQGLLPEEHQRAQPDDADGDDRRNRRRIVVAQRDQAVAAPDLASSPAVALAAGAPADGAVD